MKFIIHMKKLLAVSCELPAFRKLKAILAYLKNLQPTTYNQQSSSHNLPPTTYHLPPSSGFTLIETLVAISILMIAVASPLTIAQKGLASAIYAKDQIIASYLAQDAIEYIINASGQNVANVRGWLDGISGAGNCGTACAVNTRLDSGIASCSGTCTPLNYNESTYIYNHDAIGGSNKASPFTRTVKVEESPANEALITVTIYWKDKNTDRTLNFYTRIYNWKS